MFSSRIRAAFRQQWAGLIALFLTLSGGVAWATHPGGANTISSTDIINGEVRTVDLALSAVNGGRLAPNSVNTGKVLDESLRGQDLLDSTVTGADVDESTLGQVPSALLGGIGRWTSPEAECNPESASMFTCAFTSINLPEATRVLMIGVVKAQGEGLGAEGTGHCLLATQFSNIIASTSGFDGGPSGEHAPLIAITDVGPGSVDFAVRCNELSGNIRYFDTAVAAVALSPD